MCSIKKQPKALRVGKVYHFRSCDQPMLYLGFFKTSRELDGVTYRAGWQFLTLGWEPNPSPADRKFRARHQPAGRRQQLLDAIHVPE